MEIGHCDDAINTALVRSVSGINPGKANAGNECDLAVTTLMQSLTPIRSPFIPAFFRVDINVSAAFRHCKSNITRHFNTGGAISDAADFLLCKRASFLILFVQQEWKEGRYINEAHELFS
nr:hypothetical protein [Pantoea agglomerans]